MSGSGNIIDCLCEHNMKSNEWAGVGNVVKTLISSSTCSTGCFVGVYFSVAYRSEGVSAQPMKLQQVHASAEKGEGGGESPVLW